MARRRTAQELERQEMAKSIRSFIRLKYSVAADEEINDVLWNILDEYDAALAAGQPFDFALGELANRIKRLK